VKIQGFVDEATLQSLYAGATATLIPSLIEGFGLPVIESFRAGTPVIGSTAGSLPEVIGQGGVCIPPTDEDGFAQAMLDFEKKGVRAKYKKYIRVQLEKFTVKKFVESVSEAIDSVSIK
jgi:glycosyltransferase involved in cell wall biosynthesis